MTLPTKFADALAAPRALLTLVLEVEGLKTAYSNRALDASTWYGTSPRLNSYDRPVEIKPFWKLGGDGNPIDPGLSAVSLDLPNGRVSTGTATIKLVDADGTLANLAATLRDQSVYLRNEIAAVSTGDPHVSTVFHLDGAVPTLDDADYVYLGRETILVSALDDVAETITGRRGQFRSDPGPHPGEFDLQGNAPGILNPVTAWPRTLIDRRVWLRMGLCAPGATIVDSDAITVFSGRIQAISWEDYGRTLSIQCEDQQSQGMRSLFSDLAKWVSTPGADAPNVARWGALTPDKIGGDTAQDVDQWQPMMGVGAIPQVVLNDLHEQDSIFGVVDDMPVQYRYDPDAEWRQHPALDRANHNDDSLTNDWTGQTPFTIPNSIWFTALPPPYDDPPAAIRKPFKPMVLVTQGSPHGADLPDGVEPYENFQIGWPESVAWTDPDTGASYFVQGDHVLCILLLILTSTGTGDFRGSGTPGWNGGFDLLKREWGLGVRAEDVDIAGILGLAQTAYSRKIRIPVLDVVEDAREWLIQMLRPFGYFLRVNTKGQISVGSIDTLLPNDKRGLPTLSLIDLALDSSGQPVKLQGPTYDGLNRALAVKWSDSPFIRDGKIELRQPITIQVLDGGAPYDGASGQSPIEINAPGLYSVSDKDFDNNNNSTFNGLAFFKLPHDAAPGLTSVAPTLLSHLWAHLGGAPAVITIEVSIRKWELAVGDPVSISLPLPNPLTGSREFTNAIGMITKKQPKIPTATVEYEVKIAAAGNERSRYIAPSLDVASWDGDTKVLGINPQDFVDADADSSLRDLKAFLDGGAFLSTLDVSIFDANMDGQSTAELAPSTFDGSGFASITMPSAPSIQPPSGSPRAPVASDIVEFRVYVSQSDLLEELFDYTTDYTLAFPDGALANVLV